MGTSENCNLGHTIHSEPQASPENKGDESFFYRGEGGVGKAVINKESIGVLGIGSCSGFSLAELWQSPMSKENFFLPSAGVVK